MNYIEQNKKESKRARLFPSVRIAAGAEAEQRATAALLAVATAVSEFGKWIAKECGGISAVPDCYTEVSFPLATRRDPVQPDGMLVAKRGKKEWVALLEVKTGDSKLEKKQIDDYMSLAREHGCHTVITVSNEVVSSTGDHPVSVDGRRLRSVPLKHLSWDKLMAKARTLSSKAEVSDPDQAWILNEWIKYVRDPRSKIMIEPTLGRDWNDVVGAARSGALSATRKKLEAVAQYWDDYLRRAAFELQAELGVKVEPRVSTKEKADYRIRLEKLCEKALKTSYLSGALNIPHTAGDLDVDVDLRSKQTRFSIEIAPPNTGTQKVRTRGIVKQLKKLEAAPPELEIEIPWKKGLTTIAKLRELDIDWERALLVANSEPVPKDLNPKKFVLRWIRPFRKGRKSSDVLAGISDDLKSFYRDVVEQIEPYRPPVPKLPKVSSSENNDLPDSENQAKETVPAADGDPDESTSPV